MNAARLGLLVVIGVSAWRGGTATTLLATSWLAAVWLEAATSRFLPRREIVAAGAAVGAVWLAITATDPGAEWLIVAVAVLASCWSSPDEAQLARAAALPVAAMVGVVVGEGLIVLGLVAVASLVSGARGRRCGWSVLASLIVSMVAAVLATPRWTWDTVPTGETVGALGESPWLGRGDSDGLVGVGARILAEVGVAGVVSLFALALLAVGRATPSADTVGRRLLLVGSIAALALAPELTPGVLVAVALVAYLATALGRGRATVPLALGQTVDIGAVPVHAVSARQAVDRIVEWARERRPRFVCACSLHGVAWSQRRAEVLRAHQQADLVLPDGVPLVWALRRAGVARAERIEGPRILRMVSAAAADAGIPQYFFGGRPEVTERVVERLREANPDLVCAGIETPDDVTTDADAIADVCHRIEESGAGVVWVALGAPRQELWMAQAATSGGPAVFIGVGAAFDFVAESAVRAPQWMQRAGLEWLHRLVREPRRIGRRLALEYPHALPALVRRVELSDTRAEPRGRRVSRRGALAGLAAAGLIAAIAPALGLALVESGWLAATVASLVALIASGADQHDVRLAGRVGASALAGLALIATPALLRSGAALADAAALVETVPIDAEEVELVFDQAAVLAERADHAANDTGPDLARLLPLGRFPIDWLRTITDGAEGAIDSARPVAFSLVTAAEEAGRGELDLVGLAETVDQVDELTAVLREARARLDSASVETFAPLRRLSESLDAELDAAIDSSERLAAVLEVAPSLGGSARPQTYVVLFGTASEARELGGFVGAYAIVSIDDGDVEALEIGTNERANEALAAAALDPVIDAGSSPRWAAHQPHRFLQNVTGSPDFPDVARSALQIFAGLGWEADGVIYLDPYGLEALLGSGGPLVLDEHDLTIPAEEIASWLHVEQYWAYPDETERNEVVTALVDATIPRLDGIASGATLGALSDLDAAIDGRNLMLFHRQPEVQRHLVRAGAAGEFGRADGHTVAVVASNAGPNKLDSFLDIDTTYALQHDDTTGQTAASVTVELANRLSPGIEVPAVVDFDRDGRRGRNTVMLSLYTDVPVETVHVDGIGATVERYAEFGLERTVVFVETNPGEASVVDFSTTAFAPEPGAPIAFVAQPRVRAPTLSIEGAVDVDGCRPNCDDGTWAWTAPIVGRVGAVG